MAVTENLRLSIPSISRTTYKMDLKLGDFLFTTNKINEKIENLNLVDLDTIQRENNTYLYEIHI